jgi:hypothetical protein
MYLSPTKPTHQIFFLGANTSLLVQLTGKTCTVISIDADTGLQLELETTYFPAMQAELEGRVNAIMEVFDRDRDTDPDSEDDSEPILFLPEDGPTKEAAMASIYNQLILERFLPSRLLLENVDPDRLLVDYEEAILWIKIGTAAKVELLRGRINVRMY